MCLKLKNYSATIKTIGFILLISFVLMNSSFDRIKVDCIEYSFYGAQIETPQSKIVIDIDRVPFGGNTIMELIFGFRWDSDDGVYRIGFQRPAIEIQNSAIHSTISGIGFDRFREYPFAYTTEGCIFDYWTNGTPNYSIARPFAAWTPLNSFGAYLGPITEENITLGRCFGDVLEFENLTVYYEDGTAIHCTPHSFTIGANFTKTGSTWNVEYITNSTISNEGLISLSLSQGEPVSIVVPIVGIGVGSVIALVYFWKRKEAIQGIDPI